MVINTNIRLVAENTIEVTASAVLPNLCYEFGGVVWVEHKAAPKDGMQEIVVSVPRIKGTEGNFCLAQFRTQDVKFRSQVADWFKGVHFKAEDGTSLHKLRFAVSEGNDLPDLGTFFIKGMNTVSDKVVIEVGYGGGCREHLFQLRYDGFDLDDKLLFFVLSHDDDGDTCKALKTETLEFDFSGVPAPDFSADGGFRLALRNHEGVEPTPISVTKFDNPIIIDRLPPEDKR